MRHNWKNNPIDDTRYELKRAIKITAEEVVGHECLLDKKNEACSQHHNTNTRTKREKSPMRS